MLLVFPNWLLLWSENIIDKLSYVYLKGMYSIVYVS
jgi:hypothetical protein